MDQQRRWTRAEAIILVIRNGLVESDIEKVEQIMAKFVQEHKEWKKGNYSISTSKCRIKIRFKFVPYDYCVSKGQSGSYLDKEGLRQLRTAFTEAFKGRINEFSFQMLSGEDVLFC